MTSPCGDRGRQTRGRRGEIQEIGYEKRHIWQKNQDWDWDLPSSSLPVTNRYPC